MADLQRAEGYVRRHGSALELARLEYILSGAPAPDTVSQRLFGGQRSDGGWPPFWAPDYSSVDATCFRIAQADALGLSGAGPVRAALQFLLSRQQDDGSWEEDGEVAGKTPPWAKPGDQEAQLYLTANCGFWLAMLGEEPSAARAGDFLLERMTPAGALPSFAHTHWLAAGLWYRLERREAAERVGEHMTMELVGTLPASNLAWLCGALSRAGFPPDRLLLRRARDRLAQAQRADGRWVSEDGPAQDVHVTLEALQALGG